MATSVLAALGQRFLKLAAPPSLSDLQSLLLSSESYAEFMRLVREFTPDLENGIRAKVGAANKMSAFAKEFENRYFPLHPAFMDGLEDDYDSFVRDIPIILMCIDFDAYHEIAQDDFRIGLMLCAYILDDPYESLSEHQGGERVAIADSCRKYVREEDLRRVPEGGFDNKEIHRLLDNTQYAALADVSDILNFCTGVSFYDNDHDNLNAGGPEWSRENVDDLTKDWLKGQAIDERVQSLYYWLEADMKNHFAELLDFIEKRRSKLAVKHNKSKVVDIFKPRPSDIAWVVNLVNNLALGGVWTAPAGFTFEKVGDMHLRLVKLSVSPKKRAEAEELIRRTVTTGQAGGVKVDIDLLDESKWIGGDKDGNGENRRITEGTGTAPVELTAGPAGGAGSAEDQARLF